MVTESDRCWILKPNEQTQSSLQRADDADGIFDGADIILGVIPGVVGYGQSRKQQLIP